MGVHPVATLICTLGYLAKNVSTLSITVPTSLLIAVATVYAVEAILHTHIFWTIYAKFPCTILEDHIHCAFLYTSGLMEGTGSLCNKAQKCKQPQVSEYSLPNNTDLLYTRIRIHSHTPLLP